MRVAITHHTIRKGWLFKTMYYAVDCAVHFSHEEKQIIRQRTLEKSILLARRPATARVDDRDEQFALSVADLITGTDRHLCATPGHAKLYQEELLVALEQLKTWVSFNAEEGTRTVVEF